MKRILSLVLFGSVVFISCSKSSDSTPPPPPPPPPASCTGVTPSFSTDVNPIIQGTCATNTGCHGTGSSNGPGELTTYAKISAAKANISSAVSSGIMPKTGSLTASQKTSILCWISNGAPNN